MKEEIIIAGFGGQGVLSMGKILAYSAIMQDMEVTWMPSYGPEMRGGTANVCVILSDRKISSPIVTKYDTAIILNQQSLDKFESAVKPGGLLIYDPNGIIRHPERTDITVCRINAVDVAAKVGNSKVTPKITPSGILFNKNFPTRYPTPIVVASIEIEKSAGFVQNYILFCCNLT